MRESSYSLARSTSAALFFILVKFVPVLGRIALESDSMIEEGVYTTYTGPTKSHGHKYYATHQLNSPQHAPEQKEYMHLEWKDPELKHAIDQCPHQKCVHELIFEWVDKHQTGCDTLLVHTSASGAAEPDHSKIQVLGRYKMIGKRKLGKPVYAHTDCDVQKVCSHLFAMSSRYWGFGPNADTSTVWLYTDDAVNRAENIVNDFKVHIATAENSAGSWVAVPGLSVSCAPEAKDVHVTDLMPPTPAPPPCTTGVAEHPAPSEDALNLQFVKDACSKYTFFIKDGKKFYVAGCDTDVDDEEEKAKRAKGHCNGEDACAISYLVPKDFMEDVTLSDVVFKCSLKEDALYSMVGNGLCVASDGRKPAFMRTVQGYQLSQENCEDACSSIRECIGYVYSNSLRRCIVYTTGVPTEDEHIPAGFQCCGDGQGARDIGKALASKNAADGICYKRIYSDDIPQPIS